MAMGSEHFIQALAVQAAVEQALGGILDDDQATRSQSLSILIEDLGPMLEDPHQFVQMYLGAQEEGTVWTEDEIKNASSRFQRTSLRSLCRFASESMHEDVRAGLRQLITHALNQINQQDPGLVVDIEAPKGWLQSKVAFVHEPSLTESDMGDALRMVYMQSGRLTHIDRLMAWHPAYMAKYNSTQTTLFQTPGSLPLPWTHYIAIMAASRHHCSYLAELHTRKFLATQGDETWLRGLQHAPTKIANLAELNALLAHQPWLIKQEHVQGLMTGEDSWSMAELVHALLVMATTHSLTGFVFGLGLEKEVDWEMPWSTVGRPRAVSGKKRPRQGKRASLAERDDDTNTTEPVASDQGEAQSDEQAPNNNEPWNIYLRREMDTSPSPALPEGEEKDKLFANATVSESENSDTSAGKENRGQVEVVAPLLGFRGDIGMKYVDFDVRSDHYGVFRSADWSWDDNGYDSARHVMSEAADAIDDEFQHVLNMTDGTINGVETSTTAPFRHAVWFYTHRLFGILHDDYNYRLLNKLMPRKLKHYIKRVACQPEQSDPKQLDNLDVTLKPKEHVHVVLLIKEARKQAELLYGLKAIYESRM